MEIDFKKIETLIEKNINELKDKKGNFCISTSIPHQWLIDEEGEWDKDITYESLKSRVNAQIVRKIKEETGKKYSASNANFRIRLDLKNYKLSTENEPIFIFGRYEKYSREISQTRWICRKCNGRGCMHCDDKGKNYLSLEEIIGDEFKKEFGCENYYLHASGREDVDVENHAGRAFVLQIVNPKKIEVNFKKIRTKIEKTKKIRVNDLKMVDRRFVEMVSNSHFNKSYIAEIELGRKVLKKDLKKLKEFSGVILKQKTPTRVKHRRKDTIRKRRVISIDVLKYCDNKIELEIITEPGTYIKELIGGDNGRTQPNISETLGTNAECTKLTVSKIYDKFLDGIQ